MSFASRSDLLARSSARRLGQLAVPTDAVMPPEEALRVAIDGGSLAAYTADEQAALTLALDAVDKALADADALILSYGIPAAPQTTQAALSQLARMSSTVALFYLQGTERMTDTVQKAYDGVIAMLKSHKRGESDLVPPLVASALPEDQVLFDAPVRRYGKTASAVPSDW